jgi:transposase
MIRLDDKTRKELQQLRRRERDVRRHTKLSVILNLDRGLSYQEVAAFLDLDDSTVYRYASAYAQKTLDQYLSDSWVAFEGKLSSLQKDSLKAEVSNNLYTTTKQIAFWLKNNHHVDLSTSALARLLVKLGFSYKKTKLVPAKADADKQSAHIKDFESLMAQKDSNTLVFFNDGVHPQHNTRSEYGWILRGQEYEMPSNPGRSRLNISGAINSEDPTDVVVVEHEMVNSQSTILVWEKIEKKYPDKQFIHFCDNAAYYKSKMITDWLALHPRTKVKFLPPYSPNLNPIERLWKFMKKEVINSFYYDTISEFRRGIMDFFKNIAARKNQLKSLITLNFRVVRNNL